MSSTVRIASSRANGAKSRGPVTPEGKAISAANAAHSTGPVTPEGKVRAALNALNHGLLAKCVLLPRENPEAFEILLSDLIRDLEPETPLELRLVEIMAVADWRRNRAWFIESAQYARAMHAQDSRGLLNLTEEDARNPAMHVALAFTSLNDHSTVLQNLNRYEVRYSREYNRALSLFLERRAERRKKEEERSRKDVFSKRTEPKTGKIPIDNPAQQQNPLPAAGEETAAQPPVALPGNG